MARQTISEAELLDRAMELFRVHGYEGVSISQLSEATGLEKASLYYRYPGGKEEIAQAMLARVMQGMQEYIFDPLKGEGTPRKRLAVVIEALRTFYCDGEKPCIIEMMSVPVGSPGMAEMLKTVMQAWLKSFTEIARESGLTSTVARQRAEEAIAQFQGALVLSRVLGDKSPFQRCLKALPDLLIA